MKKFIATILTALLATAGFAQTVDAHAKAQKGAVWGEKRNNQPVDR